MSSPTLSKDEAEVLETFGRLFGDAKSLYLYGIGPSTGFILDRFPDLKVKGLLDPETIGQVWHGHEVVPLERVLEDPEAQIVVVARDAVVRIIRRRIHRACLEAGVGVFDVEGNDLIAEGMPPSLDDPAWDLTEESVRRQIRDARTVSFELLDVLLMRKTLEPGDVDTLVLQRVEDDPLQVSKDLSALRLAVERDVLVVRKAVKRLYEFAVGLGREVTLIADETLPSTFVAEILEREGITGHARIVPREQRPSSSEHLHIGRKIDVHDQLEDQATYVPIPSATEMLRASPAHQLLSVAAHLSSKLQLGMVVAHAFNDPFLFARTGGRIAIDDARDVARVIMGPLLSSFMAWLEAELEQSDIDELLLAARDGHLVQGLFEDLREMRAEQGSVDAHQVAVRYVLTSRMAITLPMVHDRETLMEVAGIAFSGSLPELLSTRFLLDSDKISAVKNGETREEYLDRHSEAIYERANAARAGFQRYLDREGISPASRYGFFDFVSSGTCQSGFESMLGVALVGYYFLRINLRGEKSKLAIRAPWAVDSPLGRQGGLSSSYVFLENFMSSPDPSLRSFDEDGQPVYLTEARSEDEIALLRAVHAEVRGFFRGWLRLIGSHRNAASNVAVSDAILRVINSQCMVMSDSIVSDRHLQDEFCNRTFSWAESVE